MDLVVGVDLVNDLEELLLAHILGQQELLHRHAQGLRPLGGALLIAQIVGPLAAADNSQRGLHPLCLQSLAVSNNAGVELFIDFLA